ncbi:hypothetical protein [Rhizobium leguminosarum]|uniref:hypothetical protein n=1 Tax=Rhizobium leguminosarum TaxID=384 RepID=UPI00103D12B2|nr:hypothetical protein [Rhizobium leguminosarum]TBY41591.1 hypothetical protein E0H54_30850 [Rhizobium leguminosarum bv. viciae]
MLKKIYHIEAGETELYEIDARQAVAKFPKEWSETPWPAAPEPKAPFLAKEKTAGWWAIFDADDKQVGGNMRKPDAEAFNAMSDEDKAELVKSEASQG